MPLPQMLQMITAASATKASSQLLWQLLHSITEDVCREKGVSVEKVTQLKKQVEEGTYEPDPMAIARAMYNL